MQIKGKLYDLSLTLTGRSQQHIFLKKLKQMEKASEVSEIQEMLLGNLINHAYSMVPYYRQVIDKLGGLDYLKKHNPTAVLSRMPLLSKDLLRAHFEDLKSKDLAQRKWYYNTSGGSTGEPVKFIQDWTYHQWVSAVKTLFDSWTGYSTGMPKILLWGSERDLLVGKETARTRFARYLKNEIWLNTFRMTEKDMLNYVRVINEVHPVQILAYVESIYELSRFIERKGLEVYSPHAIMTSAGTLYPHMRDVIEGVFKSPVFNRYGSREVGDIACECEAHKGLHVSPLTHYVEILRDDGTPAAPGEVGEVVVTLITNYSMPLIRYRIGDMATWAEDDCSCGRKWPLLKEVTGRVTDVFLREDGGVVVPEYFIHMLGVVVNAPWIRKFQVIQERLDRIRLLVVLSNMNKDTLNEIEKAKPVMENIVKTIMGDKCSLEIEIVSDIPPSPSGKYRYTISKVHRYE